jgi:hypothetical protein
MTFYPGLHHPHIAHHFPRAMISINTIRKRKSGLTCRAIVLQCDRW